MFNVFNDLLSKDEQYTICNGSNIAPPISFVTPFALDGSRILTRNEEKYNTTSLARLSISFYLNFRPGLTTTNEEEEEEQEEEEKKRTRYDK